MRAEKCRMSWGLAKSLDQARAGKAKHQPPLHSDIGFVPPHKNTDSNIYVCKKDIFFRFSSENCKLCIVVTRHVAATIGYYEVFCNFEQSVPSITITMKPETLR